MFLLISSHFQSSTFEIITITVTEIVSIQMFFLPLVLNKKIKLKIWNTIAPSCKLLNAKEFHFSFAWVMEFSIISSCLGIVKVFPIILPTNLVDVQRLHEKGKFFYAFQMGFSHLCWLFIYELSGCAIDFRCTNLNIRYFACFKQRAPWHSGNNRVETQSKRRMRHDIRTHC